MYVVFIHGPAAVGKYTIGSILSELTGLPLFHNHYAVDAAKSLFDFGTPPFNNLRAAIWRTAFAEAAVARRSFIFTFHPEASVQPSLIGDLVEIVEMAGGSVHLIELTCSRGSTLKRLSNESRSNFGKLTDPDLYRVIEEQGGFAFPPLPSPVITVDTDELEPANAARRIADAIAAG